MSIGMFTSFSLAVSPLTYSFFFSFLFFPSFEQVTKKVKKKRSTYNSYFEEDALKIWVTWVIDKIFFRIETKWSSKILCGCSQQYCS